ncbi:MAG: phosphate transport regulator [Chlamydiae bacterium SM23_39]|nr:MAG: phosphate transport regulator [Chlamydiae bacterium SM23_39]
MLTIAKLFGKSPFTPLQNHMKKVSSCIKELPSLFIAISEKDMKKIEVIAKKISKLEHEADLTKNDIRNHLPRSLFLPINRIDILDILSLQDSFADKAEDIAVLATFKILENYEDLKKDFEIFYKENIESFVMVKNVIKEFDSLLEASFGGIEAEKVKEMIELLALKEHKIDRLQYNIIKKLYSLEEKMKYSTFNLWQTMIKEIGSLSNLAETLGNRIRMILELK